MSKVLSPVAFPIWWYSEGVSMAWHHLQINIHQTIRSTGLVIFLKNMFQPLYGDYTRSGRAISFFLRCFLLIFVLGWGGLRIGLNFAGFLLHLVALPLAIVMIIYQLIPL